MVRHKMAGSATVRFLLAFNFPTARKDSTAGWKTFTSYICSFTACKSRGNPSSFVPFIHL
jgi:hypothetical protein